MEEQKNEILIDLDETLDEVPAPEDDIIQSEPNIEVSAKLKTRSDYIDTIRDVCEKLNKECPKNLQRMRLKDLKKLLASLTAEGIKNINGVEAPSNTGDDYAVMMLYTLNKLVLNIAESVSHKYGNKIGFELEDVCKNLEQNEEQKASLKLALLGVWLEYKKDIEPYMSPVTTLLLVNMTIISSNIKKHTKVQKQENKTIVEV